MTKEQAKQKLCVAGKINTLSKVECDFLIDKIYDDFEHISCDGCIYKPKRQGIDCYAEECGSCKRFYGDMHLTKEHEFD